MHVFVGIYLFLFLVFCFFFPVGTRITRTPVDCQCGVGAHVPCQGIVKTQRTSKCPVAHCRNRCVCWRPQVHSNIWLWLISGMAYLFKVTQDENQVSWCLALIFSKTLVVNIFLSFLDMDPWGLTHPPQKKNPKDNWISWGNTGDRKLPEGE
jgi:hypothetical protein